MTKALGLRIAAVVFIFTTATAATAETIVEDLAEISTNACFRIASGELVLPHPADASFDAAVHKLGLNAGINQAIFDMMGPATALVSRSAMANRKNGDAHLVLSSHGAMPGCRVILVGEPPAGIMDAATAALTAPAFGWKAFPEMTDTRGTATKRIFLRRDATGKPYLLNLVSLNGVPGNVQLFTTTIAVPPGVTLPEGL